VQGRPGFGTPSAADSASDEIRIGFVIDIQEGFRKNILSMQRTKNGKSVDRVVDEKFKLESAKPDLDSIELIPARKSLSPVVSFHAQQAAYEGIERIRR